MKRSALLILTAAMLAGCQSDSPTLFAPGATRVPPPATHSFNAKPPYYQPGAQTPGSGGAQPGAPAGTKWNQGALAPATFTAEVKGEATTTAKSAASESTEKPASSLRARLNGMPVNDATKPAEPRLFKSPSPANTSVIGSGVPQAQQPTPAAASDWSSNSGQ